MPIAQAVAITVSHWDQLALRGQLRPLRRGTLLVREGDPGGPLYLIVSGQLRTFSRDDGGREVTYGLYGAGEVVGEMALDGGPRSADVEAKVDSEVVAIEPAVLRDFVRAHPDFAFELMARIIRRARLATDSARSMALLDVYGRLVQVLEVLAAPADADGSRLCSPVSHADLASRVGCSREMVSRLLRDLAHGNYVELSRRRIVLRKTLPQRW